MLLRSTYDLFVQLQDLMRRMCWQGELLHMKPSSLQDRGQLGLRVRVLQVLRGADQRVQVPKMSLVLRCLAPEVFFFLNSIGKRPTSARIMQMSELLCSRQRKGVIARKLA